MSTAANHAKQTFEAYASHDAMNCSKLMHGFTSMLALKEAIDGDYPEPTPGMLFGVDYHALILEPAEFKSRYVVMPNYAADPENVDGKGSRSFSWATAYCKNKKAEFQRQAVEHGKAVITRENFDKAVAMLESIQTKRKAREIFAACHREVTLFGEIDGIEFKARADLLGGEYLADLKGTNSVNPRLFGSTAARLRYPERMSVYRELVRQNNCQIDEAWIIAVQTAKPFDCVVFPLRQHLLDEAFERVLRITKKYKRCLASGVWPGVDEGADFVEFHYPNWAMDDEDELVSFSE